MQQYRCSCEYWLPHVEHSHPQFEMSLTPRLKRLKVDESIVPETGLTVTWSYS